MTEEKKASALKGTNMLESCRVRFFVKVLKTDDCWEWQAAKDSNGYGRFWFQGQMQLAYHIGRRLSGKPDEYYLRHKCNNPGCVNPDHLLLGTHADNMRDLALAGTHGNRKVDPKEALEFRKAGLSIQAIAKHYDVSKTAVYNSLKRHEGYANCS